MVLSVRPMLSQFAIPRELFVVAGHSVCLVFSSYGVAGKKPEVQVLAEKSSHVPVEVVYCGYWMGFGSPLNVARTF